MTCIDIYISSITGNTRQIADALITELKTRGIRIYVDPEVPSPDATLTILCFWCRKAGMDPRTLQSLSRLKDRQVLTFGTMGYYPESEYGDCVRRNVGAAVEASGNICAGVFLCQGRIPAEKTDRRHALPPTDPHYLDDAGYARHLEGRSHPNASDLENAVLFLRQHI